MSSNLDRRANSDVPLDVQKTAPQPPPSAQPVNTPPASKITCPRCHSTERERIHRNWWLRLIPQSRQYLCIRCYKKYVTLNHDKHNNKA
jgi:hypothetical protein